MNRVTTFSIKRNQHGVVLVFSLLLLSALTVIALAGMKTSTMGEKMSSNYRNSELAQQSAESALIEAATIIDNMVSPNAGLTNTNGLIQSGNDVGKIELNYLDRDTWDPASPQNYTVATDLGGPDQLAQPPKYTIKHLDAVDLCNSTGLWDPNNASATDRCKREIFRITAVGTGLTENTIKILQSYYERDTF
ncbi:MAG: PilX N-terminal domain-containing pilus assembly protein [Gammaproteobacteria bacterium]